MERETSYLVYLILVLALIFAVCSNLHFKRQRFSFRIRKGCGKKKKLVKTTEGTYIKTFREKNRLHYRTEKTCYLLLQGSAHVPQLLRFDDTKLELEIEDAGMTLREFAQSGSLPELKTNWSRQIRELVYDLAEQDIVYGDWSPTNLTLKDGVIKLIDFEQAQIPGGPQRDAVSAVTLPVPNQTLRQYLDAIVPEKRKRKKKKNRVFLSSKSLDNVPETRASIKR